MGPAQAWHSWPAYLPRSTFGLDLGRSSLPADQTGPARILDFYEATAKQWEDDLKDFRVRLVGAGLFLMSITVVGTIGFRLIDPAAGWVRSFFMTAITLTTVGYGHEVALDSNVALIFTAMLILVGMGGALYFVSTATSENL